MLVHDEELQQGMYHGFSPDHDFLIPHATADKKY